MRLRVYPTSRAIRAAKESYRSKRALIPLMMTAEEFQKRALYVPQKRYATEDIQKLILNEAADFSRLKKLGFEDDFFKFFYSSELLISFFKEISRERVRFEKIAAGDYYAEYSEHTEILKELYDSYRELLKKRGFYDEITLPTQYRLNDSFLKRFDSIEIVLEGMLSLFEIEIYEQISKIVSLKIEYTHLDTLKKMSQRFGRLGIELPKEGIYEIDLRKKEAKIVKSIDKSANIKSYTFQARLQQVFFVKNAVFEMLKAGIDPQKIAVVLPKEDFKEFLNFFDESNGFNFAMGFDFSKRSLYLRLRNLYLYLVAEPYRKRRYKERLPDIFSEKNLPKKLDSFEKFNELIEAMIIDDPKEDTDILKEELAEFRYLFEHIKERSTAKLLHLFLDRLARRKIEDIGGGQVTVIGILETRGMEFEGLVIVDFNEDVVPKPLQKDLFFDSRVRARADMPTKEDRYALQRYFYERAISCAKTVYISSVENESSSPSRFLRRLGVKPKRAGFEFETVKKDRYDTGIVMEYDFAATGISASRLKTFLQCKRRYYYYYILELKEFKKSKEMSDRRDIGSFLHEVLKRVYATNDSFFDSEELKKSFLSVGRSMVNREDHYLALSLELWARKLTPFFERECADFEKGWRVAYREKKIEVAVNGMRLYGIVDRIDKKDSLIRVFDYKSSFKKETLDSQKSGDYQLPFYAVLCESFFKEELEGVYVKDLEKGETVPVENLEKKTEELIELLNSLKGRKIYSFDMCDDPQKCRFCPYSILCNRE